MSDSIGWMFENAVPPKFSKPIADSLLQVL